MCIAGLGMVSPSETIIAIERLTLRPFKASVHLSQLPHILPQCCAALLELTHVPLDTLVCFAARTQRPLITVIAITILLRSIWTEIKLDVAAPGRNCIPHLAIVFCVVSRCVRPIR